MNEGRTDQQLLIPRGTDTSISLHHHRIRHGWVNVDIVALIDPGKCQMESDVRKVLSNAVSGTIAEGPGHVSHV